MNPNTGLSILIAIVVSVTAGLGNTQQLHAAEHPVPESPLWLTYPGEKGPGAGRHIVLIAADQEYRSEYSMPMLARLLARHHGFHCTVLFSLNQNNDVDPTQKIRWEDKTVMHNIPGLEHLEKCDLVILFSRLITLPPEQLKHIHAYLDSGKPMIGIRTANHGFIDFDYKKDGKKIDFGEGVLGGSFRNHHGRWQQDSTRGIIVEKNKEHPVLKGVKDIWGTSDVYRTFKEGGSLPEGCLPLVDGQPLVGRKHDDAVNKELIPLPVAWVKTWVGNKGKPARVFHVTMGSAQDFQSEGLRRLTVNAAYWCLQMEATIDEKSRMLAASFAREEVLQAIGLKLGRAVDDAVLVGAGVVPERVRVPGRDMGPILDRVTTIAAGGRSQTCGVRQRWFARNVRIGARVC